MRGQCCNQHSSLVGSQVAVCGGISTACSVEVYLLPLTAIIQPPHSGLLLAVSTYHVLAEPAPHVCSYMQTQHGAAVPGNCPVSVEACMCQSGCGRLRYLCVILHCLLLSGVLERFLPDSADKSPTPTCQRCAELPEFCSATLEPAQLPAAAGAERMLRLLVLAEWRKPAGTFIVAWVVELQPGAADSFAAKRIICVIFQACHRPQRVVLGSGPL